MEKSDNKRNFNVLGLTFTIDVRKWLKITLMVWLCLSVLLFLSIRLFSYEMTDFDIPGGLISGALLAYLIHILKD